MWSNNAYLKKSELYFVGSIQTLEFTFNKGNSSLIKLFGILAVKGGNLSM